jgi:predicted RNA-binding Zn-ribbon protein involved in translation (DUF1610 family)
MATKSDKQDLVKTEIFHCPKCNSTEIIQRSLEEVTSYLNKQSPAQINFNSNTQEYECEDCGFDSTKSQDFILKEGDPIQTESVSRNQVGYINALFKIDGGKVLLVIEETNEGVVIDLARNEPKNDDPTILRSVPIWYSDLYDPEDVASDFESLKAKFKAKLKWLNENYLQVDDETVLTEIGFPEVTGHPLTVGEGLLDNFTREEMDFLVKVERTKIILKLKLLEKHDPTKAKADTD